MTGRTLLAAATLCLASPAFGQGRGQINVLRVEPTGEGEGKALALEGFYYIGSPCYSKDGEWIAFDGYKRTQANAKVECWVVRSDGTEPKRLARGATPRWSPDGTKILFMREERKDLGRPGGEKIGVFVVDADGTDERWLADGRWPDWSPDGKQIVYSVGGTSPGGSPRMLARIVIANADGTKPREIAIGDCPSWSPDGKKIACSYKDPALPSPMIRLIDVEDSEQQVLLGYGWFRPNWSPDGKSLYSNGIVPAQVPGRARSGMVRTLVDRKADPEPILTSFEGQSPCPSPDGKSVVFCTTQPEPTQIQ